MDAIEPKKRIEVEYVKIVYNPQPQYKPKYLHNFGDEDSIVINHVNLKRGTYVKETYVKESITNTKK